MIRLIVWLMLAAALSFPAPASADDDDDKPKDKAKIESKGTAKGNSKARTKDDAEAKSNDDDQDDGKKEDHKDQKDGTKGEAKDEAKGGTKPDVKDAPKTDGKDEAKLEESEPVVRVTVLKSATQSAAYEGTATVLSTETLFQFEADIRTTRIAADFSKAQLARAETLFRDKFTVSRQEMETAARQSATDALQLNVLEQKLKLMWGDGAPFLDADARHDVLAKLSKGDTNIVRLDFPGAGDFKPKDVKITRLTGGESISVDTLWPAPQGNQAMPGAAFLGLATAGGLKQGDRASVTANGGETKSGVVIPHGAIILTEGRAWCYIEKKHGKFVRRPVSLESPAETGYFAKSGFSEGDKVVIRGAGHLLAREAGPGGDDDDK